MYTIETPSQSGLSSWVERATMVTPMRRSSSWLVLRRAARDLEQLWILAMADGSFARVDRLVPASHAVHRGLLSLESR